MGYHKGISDAAMKCLPQKKIKKKNFIVKDEEPKDLCKAELSGRNGGHPSHVSLPKERNIPRNMFASVFVLACTRLEQLTIPRKRSHVQGQPPLSMAKNFKTTCHTFTNTSNLFSLDPLHSPTCHLMNSPEPYQM